MAKKISDLAIHKTAVFSEDRKHRYCLTRVWGNFERGNMEWLRMCMFVGLNPSTATETEDDPTVRRCIAYAYSWGYDGLYMTNIFGFRATDPKVMLAYPDPVGAANDAWLLKTAGHSGIVVAAWGAHGAHLGRGVAVRNLLSPAVTLRNLGLTKAGQPKHPLYLPRHLTPEIWG